MNHLFPRLRLFSILLLLLSCSNALWSQEKPTKAEKKAARKARRAAVQHYLQIGTTGTRIHFYDANVSEQLYGGWGIGGLLAWHSYEPKAFTRAEFISGSYTPIDALTAGPGGFVGRGKGGYVYAFKLKPWWKGRLQPYLGPSLNGFYTVRSLSLGNSGFNDELNLNLALAGHLRYDFTLLNKPAFATYSLQLPLFSYLLSEPLFGVTLGDSYETFAPLGRFTQTVSELSLNRQIGQTDNYLQIGYSWDYYAYRKSSKALRFAQHGLTLALMIRL